MFVWKLLIWLRIFMTLLPQSGYIHPDEFFQSLEVVAGDVLNVKVNLPWEFNATLTKEPIRNIVIPYVLIGFPLYLMKCLSELTETFLGVTLLTPCVVLTVPRLTMTLISLWTDLWLKRVCKLTEKNHVQRLKIYASSYVVFVFMSRTLSNAVECFLYAHLLMTVTECIREIDLVAGATTSKRRKTEKRNVGVVDQRTDSVVSTPRCNQIAILVTIGTFNRPTFLAFAFVPVVIWTLYGFQNPAKNFAKIVSRLFSLFPGFFIVSSLFVACDTLYYGRITIPTLLRWNSIVSTRWVVTPLNFVLYNVDGENLSKHGLHSNYVHFLFNNFLLFNVLGLIGIFAYVKMLYSVFYLRQLANISAVDKLMSCGFAFPLLILSLFPHQEPRFIIPVLFPLVYLHADKLTRTSILSRFALGVWVGFGAVAFAFFGFLHQGGIVQSLFYLQQARLSTDSIQESVNQVVYYRTYMPPVSLLLLPKDSDECGESDEFRVYDLMGQSPDMLNRKIASLRSFVYVVSPTSLRKVVTEAIKPYDSLLVKWFCLHLSMEDLPPLNSSFFDGIGLDVHMVEVWKNVTRVQYFSTV